MTSRKGSAGGTPPDGVFYRHHRTVTSSNSYALNSLTFNATG